MHYHTNLFALKAGRGFKTLVRSSNYLLIRSFSLNIANAFVRLIHTCYSAYSGVSLFTGSIRKHYYTSLIRDCGYTLPQ
jgi:hypothetical protein